MNNPVAASMMLGALIGIPFVFVIVCYASAGCLRIAAKWLNFGTIDRGTAFKTVLIAHFTVLVINFSIVAQFASMFLGSPYGRSRNGYFEQMVMGYSSSYSFYGLGVCLGLTALFFCRMLYRGENEERLPFFDALILSALHYALLSASIFLLVGSTVLFVYAVVSFMPFP